MDVTVSHLNNRLALQLPPELPLGLVFVVGAVEELQRSENGRSPQVQFALVEQSYRVHCRLSPRAASEIALREGMTIRAGGHLAFDAQWAGYFLLVRDVEIVQAPPASEPVPPPVTDLGALDRTAVAAILTDIKKRSDAAHLAQADLPPWVQKIAPPEVQAELQEKQAAAPPVARPTSPPRAAIDADLLARLSAAMDSEEEVELTSDMLANVSDPLAAPSRRDLGQAYDVPPAMGWEDPQAVPPSSRRPADLILMLLAILFIILAIVLIVAIWATF